MAERVLDFEQAQARVLVVEDDEDLRTTLQMLLEVEGYTVEATDSGAEALAAVERSAQAVAGENPGFRAALVDFQLPDISGPELVHRLRQLPGLRSARLIAMTGALTDLEGVRASGFDDLLAKPVHVETLRRALGPA